MLGAIIGDTAESVYEFDNIKTTDFPFFSPRSNYTEHTYYKPSYFSETMNRITPDFIKELRTETCTGIITQAIE